MQGVLIGGLAHGTVREFGDRQLPVACSVEIDPDEHYVSDEEVVWGYEEVLYYIYTGVLIGDVAYYSLP